MADAASIADAPVAALQYTYNFQGNSQDLDHIYVTPALQQASRIDIVHMNSGLPTAEQASDHDPAVAAVRFAVRRSS